MIFAMFTPYDRVLGVDDRSELFFQYLKERCHGNQFCGKIVAKLPTPCTYSETEWDIATTICINSVNDASVLCEIQSSIF